MLNDEYIMPKYTPPVWEERAACVDADPEVFFPESFTGSVRYAMEEQAKKICSQCPVRAECLELSIKNEEQYGIWGGMTSDQRRALIRRRRREQMMNRRYEATRWWPTVPLG